MFFYPIFVRYFLGNGLSTHSNEKGNYTHRQGTRKATAYYSARKSLNFGNKKLEHEIYIISCSDSFLPYVSDKTKKSEEIFVCYLCFCLSLRQIYIRYLRSNG